MPATKPDPRTATSRPRGAVGRDPLVYRAYREIIPHGLGISTLDFGAGKGAAHTLKLRAEGYDVRAVDLCEVTETYPGEIRHEEKSQYAVVLASNVLNVQGSRSDVAETLGAMRDLLLPGGLLICNYPLEPRKPGMSTPWVGDYIRSVFSDMLESLYRVGGTQQAPVWALSTFRKSTIVRVPSHLIKR